MQKTRMEGEMCPVFCCVQDQMQIMLTVLKCAEKVQIDGNAFEIVESVSAEDVNGS